MKESQGLRPGYRRQVFDTARRVVVKVGSAVLTTENGLDLELIQGLARQVSGLLDAGREVVMVSSGAVAAGRRVIAASVELNGLPARQAASAVGQSRLMHAYDEAFAGQGKVTAQILVSKDGLESRRRFLHARNTLATLLSWRAVPIVNENDTVAVEELEFGDNDFLASLIVNLVEADLMVNLTSAEGVFSANPDRDAGAYCLECIPDIAGLDLDALCSGKSTVGTGGMYSKLLSARRVAQLGVPSLILSGRTPDALTRVFGGEDLGTLIVPQDKAVSRRKYWMAYNQDVVGVITVDGGAVEALVTGGKSLLPAGVLDVAGSFEAGGLVRIKSRDGRSLGVGLSNYDSSELAMIKGRHSSEIPGVLGRPAYPEVVHRNNLLLDAAL